MRSPLHPLLGGRLALLTFYGHKSGRDAFIRKPALPALLDRVAASVFATLAAALVVEVVL